VWAELHEKVFRRLGGSPRVVVLDNLREGVLSPDFYDPGLNPLYRDVLAHYGVTALPCKVRDPDRKGKVESGVNHAQMTPLKGKKFESLEEAQAYRRRQRPSKSLSIDHCCAMKDRTDSEESDKGSTVDGPSGGVPHSSRPKPIWTTGRIKTFPMGLPGQSTRVARGGIALTEF
jgi:hypothetical protein